MFKTFVNGACKQFVENMGMHETARRLYAAISEITNQKTSDLGDVAAYVKVTPQVLKNWESRGVSKQGCLGLHRQFGINPEWLATGKGEMRLTPLSSTSTVGGGLSIEQALEVVAAKLNELPSDAREAAAQGLQTLARAPDSAKALQALQATLGAAPPEPMRSMLPIPAAETRDFAPRAPADNQFLKKQPA